MAQWGFTKNLNPFFLFSRFTTFVVFIIFHLYKWTFIIRHDQKPVNWNDSLFPWTASYLDFVDSARLTLHFYHRASDNQRKSLSEMAGVDILDYCEWTYARCWYIFHHQRLFDGFDIYEAFRRVKRIDFCDLLTPERCNYFSGHRNVLRLYLHRYLRITPVLAVLILLSVSILRHYPSEPLQDLKYEMFSESCEKYFWSALLHVQNYVNPENLVRNNDVFVFTITGAI